MEKNNSRKGIGSHQSAKMGKDEWLTPPGLLEMLGEFDLDPCAPIIRPWNTAKNHLTIEDDGLTSEWKGRVFCNPPYGLMAATWLNKCADHGNTIAFIFARTETRMFFDHVWNKAHGILFIEGRLFFHHVTGEKAAANSGAPSVLVAYNEETSNFLKNCNVRGKYIKLK